MVVENKRQKKLPPPRPPPPYKAAAARQDAPVLIPRSQTVSGDRPTRKPKLPADIRTGTPPLERKSAGDPVPPPRRKKKQRSPGVYPESGPTSPVKEAFGPDKYNFPQHQDIQNISREGLKEKESKYQKSDMMPTRGVHTVPPQDEQATIEKENKRNDQRARLPTRDVRSSKRKEAQKIAKAKVSV